MKTIKKTFLYKIVLTVLWLILFSVPMVMAVGNGAFDPPYTPWKQAGGCWGGAGGFAGNGGHIVPTPGFPLGSTPPFVVSAISQSFKCFEFSPYPRCYVKFKYKLNVPVGVSVGIIIKGPDFVYWGMGLPAHPLPGRWNERQVEYPRCGDTLTIYFLAMRAAPGPIGGPDNSFIVDNVDCKCDLEGYPFVEVFGLKLGNPNENDILRRILISPYNDLGGPTGLGNEFNTDIPTRFNLSQNYPNPFNPTTNINFEIPKFSRVELRIYDIVGREIAVLVNEELQPGSHTYKFDGSNYASGVYFYRIKAGDASSNSESGILQTKRMILIK